MLNLKSLKLENHSFIDEAYQETEADIVFSTSLDGSSAYIYLLLEHQSEMDLLLITDKVFFLLVIWDNVKYIHNYTT